jgi:hypothetical protein
MWMMSPDRLGFAIVAFSIILKELLYVVLGRVIWSGTTPIGAKLRHYRADSLLAKVHAARVSGGRTRIPVQLTYSRAARYKELLEHIYSPLLAH